MKQWRVFPSRCWADVVCVICLTVEPATHPRDVSLHQDLAVQALALVGAERLLQLRARESEQLMAGHAQRALRRCTEALRLQPLRYLVRVRFLQL